MRAEELHAAATNDYYGRYLSRWIPAIFSSAEVDVCSLERPRARACGGRQAEATHVSLHGPRLWPRTQLYNAIFISSGSSWVEMGGALRLDYTASAHETCRCLSVTYPGEAAIGQGGRQQRRRWISGDPKLMCCGCHASHHGAGHPLPDRQRLCAVPGAVGLPDACNLLHHLCRHIHQLAAHQMQRRGKDIASRPTIMVICSSSTLCGPPCPRLALHMDCAVYVCKRIPSGYPAH